MARRRITTIFAYVQLSVLDLFWFILVRSCFLYFVEPRTASSLQQQIQLSKIWENIRRCTVYPKKYAHGFCFAVLCCGYTLTDFLISIMLTSLALWQSNDCPSASKATLMNMDKYFMWIHYERLHNHNKAKHNKTVCIFLGIYCIDEGVPVTGLDRIYQLIGPCEIWWLF